MFPSQVGSVVDYVLYSLASVMWFTGVQVLIFLAGLQKIDRSVYEAAEIDGAGSWECFWKITLPYMKLLILINAIYTVIEIANFSGTSSTLAAGQATTATKVLQVNLMNPYILGKITDTVRPYSISAAMSWLYFIALILVLGAVLLVYKFFDRGERE
jgi:ABC-type sugar transport system permease subunit